MGGNAGHDRALAARGRDAARPRARRSDRRRHARRPSERLDWHHRKARSPASESEGEHMSDHPVVSHDEWLGARTAFLAKEKEFTRLRDELSRQRRALPWEAVDKSYVFDGPRGKQTLADLFGPRSQ